MSYEKREPYPDGAMHPFDYHPNRRGGSWLLRCCAMCGQEMTHLGLAEGQYIPHDYDVTDPPPRDRRLDYDDHDICQCEARRVRDTVPAPPDLGSEPPRSPRLVLLTET